MVEKQSEIEKAYEKYLRCWQKACLSRVVHEWQRNKIKANYETVKRNRWSTFSAGYKEGYKAAKKELKG